MLPAAPDSEALLELLSQLTRARDPALAAMFDAGEGAALLARAPGRLDVQMS